MSQHSWSQKETKIIYELMAKSICKIIINEKESATGFFLNINLDNGHILALVTNKHVLNENFFQNTNNKKILFSLNNGEHKMELNMDPSIGRLHLIEKQYDTTFVEIKEDELDENVIKFLEVDERLGIQTESLINEEISILNYPEDNESQNSPGKIFGFTEIQEIIHNCKTKKGSSGSPILSLKTFKVLGIHSGGGNKEDDKENNMGYYLYHPLDEFIRFIKSTPSQDKKEKNENVKNSSKEKKEKEQDPLNTLTIRYRVTPKDTNIKIFGTQFVENNKNKCKIIVEGNERNICEELELNDNMRRNNILEIKLKETSTINDMSYLFGGDYYDGCKALLSVSDFDKWDTKNVTNMNHLFNNCILLQSLPDISKWNTSNVTDMNTMFSNCQSLLYLPDISKWDTSNVTNMAYMFQSCPKITRLPDIGKWNIDKVIKKKDMFNGCNAENIPVIFQSPDCIIY